jgi:ABC-2 type transport system ATP-binding protein
MTLELRNVSKRFPGVLAVDNVSFSAPSGEITGYLGPNGSGKSTTMKMIAGLIGIGSGEILFDGAPIRRDLIAHKQRMGYVPEEPHLYAHLSGLEYLIMVAQLPAGRGTAARSRSSPARRTVLRAGRIHGARPPQPRAGVGDARQGDPLQLP